MTIWQRWKQTALHNKALVFSGIIVAFGTLFYSGAAVVQVWMFNKSSRQVERQTERLIDAAKTQADAAKEMTKAVEDQAKYAGEFAASAKSINEQTKLKSSDEWPKLRRTILKPFRRRVVLTNALESELG